MASANGKDDIVDLLINAKTDVNVQDKASIEYNWRTFHDLNNILISVRLLHAVDCVILVGRFCIDVGIFQRSYQSSEASHCCWSKIEDEERSGKLCIEFQSISCIYSLTMSFI